LAGQVLGFDEAGDGPVLLLVHGFPLDRRIWAEQVSGLSDIRKVVAVDLRGRGKSPQDPNGWTIDDYANDVSATIESLGVEQVDLAGLSMGGYVLFSMWKKHPEKVRSLIFVDTKGEADGDEAKEARDKTAAMVREKGSSELLNSLFPKLFSDQTTDAIKDKVRPQFIETPSETAAADALAMRDRADSTSDLGKIDVPALVIHGEDDALMPIEGKEGGYGWFVVLAGFLSNATAFGVLYSFTVFFPEIVEEFGQGQGSTSFIGSIAAAIMLATGAFTGRLADRFGPRRVVGTGAVMLSLGLLLSSVANAIWQIYLAYGVVLGLGVSFAFVPSVSAVAQWFAKRRGLATGMAVAGSGVGAAIMAPLSQSLIESGGWRSAARTLAFASLISLMTAALLVKGRSSGHRKGVARQMFADRRFRTLYFSAVVASYGYWIPFIFIVPYAREQGLTPAFAALLVSIMGIANVAGRVILGALADKVGRIRIFQTAVAAMSIAALLWPLAKGRNGLMAFGFAYGFVAGTFIALMFAITGDYFGVERMAGITGLLNTAAAVGTLIGPPITGLLFDSTGSYTIPILIAGATLAVGAAFSLTLPIQTRAPEVKAAS
jgi:pimeloyl-ACP methyl ester carboxylesterase/MFS family permease